MKTGAFIVLVLCGLAVAAATADVSCPDGSSCPTGDTCCPTGTGSYGCCPTPDATCCSDHQHCCPQAYPVCDVAAGECKKAATDMFGVPFLTKKTSKPAPEVSCPDGSSCPTGDTCCPTGTGSYGCCPTPDATCCSDHEHCCPQAYPVCDVAAGECKKAATDLYGIPLLQKRESKPAPEVSCPDGSSCPTGDTCCPTGTGSYGCCPTPDATCCSDHEHCCPQAYPVCDVAAGECKKAATDLYGIPLLQKRVKSAPVKPDVFMPEIIDVVNADSEAGWKAGVNEHFIGWDEVSLRNYMGAVLGRDTTLPMSRHAAVAAPTSFDARTKWPGCIGPVLNQARCGSCWAFAAAESISDRQCIEGKVSSFMQLAPLDIVTCDNGFFQNGCQGGMPSAAWQWVQSTGIVTEACLPYLVSEGGPIPTCAPADQPCLNFVQTPGCVEKCHNDTITYSADKHHISNVYSVTGEQQMIAELMKNGPFEVTMTVYADFPHYKSGVYQHTTGNALGGHAIKVVGFGTEGGKPYWLIQNSWTTTWGADGFFKILRGVDECGIESGGVAGTF